MAVHSTDLNSDFAQDREELRVPVPDNDSVDRDLRRAAVLLIVAIWSLHFLMMTVRLGLMDSANLGFYSASRFALSLCGAALSYGIFVVLKDLRHRPFVLQASAAASVAGIAAFAITLVNIHAFREISPASDIREYFALLLYAFMYWYWFYLFWSAAYLALSYSFTVAEQERRAAALSSAAHAAQMRALRYQVNPHFLFNALNSVASLVEENPRQAEEAVVKLSDLLRTSLVNDPLADISLKDEFDLQSTYLEIEQIRFPKRLRVQMNCPPEMLSARLPCLLLQPMVENAIKHGVARSADPVTIRLSAWKDGETAAIEISDDARADEKEPDIHGMGIGLANVRNRLKARYGSRASLVCRSGEQGFTATVRLPLQG